MQYDLNLRDYIRIIQKRRWIIILMPVAAGLFGYFWTQPLPELYAARGAVRVVKRSFPTDVFMDAFYYFEVGNYLETHAQVMTSREVLKETAVRLGLLEEGLTDEELTSSAYAVGLLQDMQRSLDAVTVQTTSIIQVVCTRPQPAQAIRWLNTLLDTYVERHTAEINRQTIEGLAFLEDQVHLVGTALTKAENELTQFKLENAGSISLSAGEIDTTQTALEETEFDLRMLEVQIRAVDQALAGGSLTGVELFANISADDPRVLRVLDELTQFEQLRRRLLSYQLPSSPEVQEVEAQYRTALDLLKAALVAEQRELERQRDEIEARFRMMPANDIDLARLQRNVDVNDELYSTLLQERQRARTREAEKVQEVSIIERAISASRIPQAGRAGKGLVAAVIGLLLGFVLALVVESLDTSIGAIEDVESLLQLPVIGIIPPIDRDDVREVVRGVAPKMLDHPDINHLLALVSHYDPRSPVAEAYRALRTNVEKARERADGKVVIVTSSVLEEGKTTTVVNLALTFAQMGRKTLLMAADLRRPDLHRILGLPKEPGVADVLTGSLPVESAVRGLSDILLGNLSMDVVMLTPGMDNLYILPSGSNPLNPAELLGSKATAELIAKLRDSYDLIFIDTPPVIPVTDAAILAEHADGIVLVYEVGKVGRDVLKRAKSHLDNVHATIWGIVMNDVKAEAETTLRDTDYYYYHYRYEDSPPDKSLRARLGKRAARLFRNSGT